MSGGAQLLTEITGEIALFAAVGGLLFALDDVAVDFIYFTRRAWRALTIYSRYARAFADAMPAPDRPGRIAVLIPAWDEASVIGAMLTATLARFEHDDYRLYVGYYRNDPATAAAIAAVADPRVRPVRSTPTAPPPRPIASTICTALWPSTRRRARRAPRRSFSTTPRISSIRSSSSCSTGLSSARRWSSCRCCRCPIRARVG